MRWGWNREATALPVLLVAIAAALLLEQSLLSIGVLRFLAGCAALVLAIALLAPRQPRAGDGDAPLSGLGAVLGLGSAAFFRLRYLWTVPAGHGFEPLAFVYFARRLYDEGFPYIPYAWYAHTLYSYAIALALPFSDSELVAARVASAAISILTAVLLYLCTRWMFGRQAAWIAVALLAPSWWHLFASRNGYHQLVMPPFHLLLVAGVVKGLRDGKRWGLYVAGVALVGALHAYWGLYLLLPYTGLLLFYLLLWQRAALRAHWRHVAGASLLTIAGLAPLGIFFAKQTEVFSYTTRAFRPEMSDAPDLLGKVVANGWYVLWALSGHVRAQVPYGSVVDPVVAAAALIGLALSLRWRRTSMAHAAIVLLFAVNVAGLCFTMANYFYIIATMAPVYLFAAVALAETLSAAQRLLPRLRFLWVLALMALIAWRSVEGYHAFFYQRSLTDVQSPFRPIGRAYTIMERIAEMVPRSTVFAARWEPGRDLSDEIFELGDRIPSYSFMRRVQPLDAAQILFPEQVLRSGRSVELIVPNEPYVERRLVPVLRKLYPHLVLEAALAPPPYSEIDATPIAMRISIPWTDLAPRLGLVSSADGQRRVGLFLAPVDGEYFFRQTLPWAGAIVVDGRPVEDGAGVFLEAGLHPIQLGAVATASTTFEYTLRNGAWMPGDPLLLNVPEEWREEVEPFLARPGRLAEFYFELERELAVGHKIRDAVPGLDGDIAAVMLDGVRLIGSLGEPRWSAALPGPRDYRGLRHEGRLLVADPNGDVLQVDSEGVTRIGHSPCGVTDLTVQKGRILILCGGSLTAVLNGGSTMPLRAADGGTLLNAVAMRSRGDTLYVIDAPASEILMVTDQAARARRWVVPNLWGDSELAVAPDGTLFVRRWRYGWRAYDREGNLLFHPVLRRPWVFSRKSDALDNLGLRRLHVSEERATLVSPDGFIALFERRRPAAPAGAAGAPASDADSEMR